MRSALWADRTNMAAEKQTYVHRCQEFGLAPYAVGTTAIKEEDDSVEDEEEEQQQHLRPEVLTPIPSQTGSDKRQEGDHPGDHASLGEEAKTEEPNEGDLGMMSDSSSAVSDVHRSDSSSSQRERRSQIDCWCNIPEMFVDPASRAAYYWMALVTLAVVYNWIVIILRMAFEEMRDSEFYQKIFRAMDTVSDVIYLMDVAIQSRTAYLEDGCLVKSLPETVRHYRNQPCFALDVLSVVPVTAVLSCLSKIGLPAFVSGLTALTTPGLRILRLLKYPSMYRFFEKTDSRTNNPNLLRAFRLSLHLWLVIHWIGCFYYLLSQYEGLGTNDWVYPNSTEFTPFSKKYIYCMYWSTMTLTTIGERPWPVTDMEYTFTGVTFLIGVFVFAAVVGNVGDVISNMNAARHDFQARMDQIKFYLNHRKVPEHLQDQIKQWAEYTWSRTKAIDEHSVLQLLPYRLRTEVAIHVHLNTLKKVRIFDQCEEGLLRELVVKLRPSIYSPGEYICRIGEIGREMYIIDHGKVEILFPDRSGRMKQVAVMMPGNYFGEISLLKLDEGQNKRTADVRSVGFSELLCLSRRDLMAALGEYPEAKRILEAQARQRMQQTKHQPSDPLSLSAGHPESSASSPQSGGSPAISGTGRRSARAIFAQVMRQEGFSKLLASAAVEEIVEIKNIIKELKEIKIQMIEAREMQRHKQGPCMKMQHEQREEDLEQIHTLEPSSSESSPIISTLTNPADLSSDTSTLTSPVLPHRFPRTPPSHSVARAGVRSSPTRHQPSQRGLLSTHYPSTQCQTARSDMPRQTATESKELSSFCSPDSLTAGTSSPPDDALFKARRRRSPAARVPKLSDKDPCEKMDKPAEGAQQMSIMMAMVQGGGGDELGLAARDKDTEMKNLDEEAQGGISVTKSASSTNDGKELLFAATSRGSDLESCSSFEFYPIGEKQEVKPTELPASSELLKLSDSFKSLASLSSNTSSTTIYSTTSTSSGGRGHSPKPAKPRPRYKKDELSENLIQKDEINLPDSLHAKPETRFTVAPPTARDDSVITCERLVFSESFLTTPMSSRVDFSDSVESSNRHVCPSSSSTDVAAADNTSTEAEMEYCKDKGSKLLKAEKDLFPECNEEPMCSGQQDMNTLLVNEMETACITQNMSAVLDRNSFLPDEEEDPSEDSCDVDALSRSTWIPDSRAKNCFDKRISQKEQSYIPRPVTCRKIDDAQLSVLLAKRREFNETVGYVVESHPSRTIVFSNTTGKPRSPALQAPAKTKIPSNSGLTKSKAAKSLLEAKMKSPVAVRRTHKPFPEQSHSVRSFTDSWTCSDSKRAQIVLKNFMYHTPKQSVTGEVRSKCLQEGDKNKPLSEASADNGSVRVKTEFPGLITTSTAFVEDVVYNETLITEHVKSAKDKEPKTKTSTDSPSESSERVSASNKRCFHNMKDGKEPNLDDTDHSAPVAVVHVESRSAEKTYPVPISKKWQCDTQPGNQCDDQMALCSVCPDGSSRAPTTDGTANPPAILNTGTNLENLFKKGMEVVTKRADEEEHCAVKDSVCKHAAGMLQLSSCSDELEQHSTEALEQTVEDKTVQSEMSPVETMHIPNPDTFSQEPAIESTSKTNSVGACNSANEPSPLISSAHAVPQKSTEAETVSAEKSYTKSQAGLAERGTVNESMMASSSSEENCNRTQSCVEAEDEAKIKPLSMEISSLPFNSHPRRKSLRQRGLTKSVCNPCESQNGTIEDRPDNHAEEATDTNAENNEESPMADPEPQNANDDNSSITTTQIPTNVTASEPQAKEETIKMDSEPKITEKEEEMIVTTPEPQKSGSKEEGALTASEPQTEVRTTCITLVKNLVWKTEVNKEPVSTDTKVARAEICMEGDVMPSSYKVETLVEPVDKANNCAVSFSHYLSSSGGSSRSECMIARSACASLLMSGSADMVQMDKPVIENVFFEADSDMSLSTPSSSCHALQAASHSFNECQDMTHMQESASSGFLNSMSGGHTYRYDTLYPHRHSSCCSIQQAAYNSQYTNHEDPSAGSSAQEARREAAPAHHQPTMPAETSDAEAHNHELGQEGPKEVVGNFFQEMQAVNESLVGSSVMQSPLHLCPSLLDSLSASSTDDSMGEWDRDAEAATESSLFLLSEFGVMDDDDDEGSLSGISYASDHSTDLEDL